MGLPTKDIDSKLTTDRVEAALGDLTEIHGEIGLQIAAYRRGVPIIDTWAGRTAPDGSEEVGPDTVFNVFSVSKAVAACAVHLQAERGLLDPDAPVAAYWPEYGTKGKGAITIRHVLTHRAGVPQMPLDITPERLGDWEWITTQLADMEPIYAPGSRNTYLSMTFGWLLGEVVRRTDPQRRGFADFVREEITEPLGMDSFWFGIPGSEQHRVATLVFPEQGPDLSLESLAGQAIPPQVKLAPSPFNRSDVQGFVIPAVGAICSARSLVRLFAMLASGGELDGVRLLSADRIAAMNAPRPDMDKTDETYGKPFPVGVGGLWIQMPGLVPETTPLVGHTGMGGSYGWAELDSGLAIVICHNRMVIQQPYTELVAAIHAHAAETA